MTKTDVINLSLKSVSTKVLEELAYENDGKGAQFNLFVNELATRSDYKI